mmetsp:Transcript_38019/g.112911  ORF Transcript_38019/g.112911 Transcript_38019/m.112911 type:complete len:359 (+) Transcript_38019:85-1161(+)
MPTRAASTRLPSSTVRASPCTSGTACQAGSVSASGTTPRSSATGVASAAFGDVGSALPMALRYVSLGAAFSGSGSFEVGMSQMLWHCSGRTCPNFLASHSIWALRLDSFFLASSSRAFRFASSSAAGWLLTSPVAGASGSFSSGHPPAFGCARSESDCSGVLWKPSRPSQLASSFSPSVSSASSQKVSAPMTCGSSSRSPRSRRLLLALKSFVAFEPICLVITAPPAVAFPAFLAALATIEKSSLTALNRAFFSPPFFFVCVGVTGKAPAEGVPPPSSAACFGLPSGGSVGALALPSRVCSCSSFWSRFDMADMSEVPDFLPIPGIGMAATGIRGRAERTPPLSASLELLPFARSWQM